MDINQSGANPPTARKARTRVHWTYQELATILGYVNEHPGMRRINAILKAQELYLPEHRHLAKSTIYAGLASGKFLLPQEDRGTGSGGTGKAEITFVGIEPDEPLPVNVDIDAIAERVAAIVLPSLVDAMRDLVVSQRLSRMMATNEDIAQVIKSNPQLVTQPTNRRRIDVVGLLPSQSEIVKTFLGPRDNLKLRFILSEHIARVDRFAPDVVMCTNFVSHMHQDKIRSSGARLHYANGAAASVTNVLGELIQ